MRRLAKARFPAFRRVRSWPVSLERRGRRSSKESGRVLWSAIAEFLPDRQERKREMFRIKMP